jgi:PIN domain nuclease of toxin-antitoxin system
MSDGLLLDTHAAIWLMNGDPLSERCRDRVRAARSAGAGVYVSAITAWEIAMLVRKQRIFLGQAPSDWFDGLIKVPGVRLAPLSPKVLIDSALLPGSPPNDPADRMVIASARDLAVPVATRDRRIIQYCQAANVDLIEC